MSPTLELLGVRVCAGATCLVSVPRLALRPGVPLTLMGETGAGKSLLLQAIMATLPDGLRAEGRILLEGEDTSPASRQALWGQRLALLPQEPTLALDPLMPSARQISEVHRWVLGATAAESDLKATAALARFGLDAAGAQRPGALSGGMAQRLAFAAAIAAGADVLLADEPTKGLDDSNRHALLELLASHAGANTLFIVTHDLAVPRRLGGNLAIIRSGKIVEQGPVNRLLTAPEHPYTQELLRADRPMVVPGFAVDAAAAPVIVGENLAVARGGRRLFEGVDLAIQPGEIVGLAGPSGIGKSSLGDALLGLLPAAQGQVRRAPNIGALRFQKLYQDPPAAFATDVPLRRLLRELIRLHRLGTTELPALLEAVGIDDEVLERPTHAVSGGELQRIALARVLLLKPVFLFADEPVSRLDPITARRVLELLVSQVRAQRCGVLLVSHDEVQLEQLCDRAFRLQPLAAGTAHAAHLVAA